MRFPNKAPRLLLLVSALGLAALRCTAQQQSSFYQSPGTKKMAELLQKIYRENDWKADPNKQAERAAYYKSLLTKNLKPEDEVIARRTLASELLRAGDSEGAVSALEELRKICKEKPIKLPPDGERQITSLL